MSSGPSRNVHPVPTVDVSAVGGRTPVSVKHSLLAHIGGALGESSSNEDENPVEEAQSVEEHIVGHIFLLREKG